MDEGLVPASDTIAVWGVRAGHDISALPKTATLIVRHQPDHGVLSNAGWSVRIDAPDAAELGLVFLPRAKAEARDMVAEAASVCSGPVIIDGQKSDGIESLLKTLKAGADLGPPLSKNHGKLAVLAPGATLADWRLGESAKNDDGFWTAPGIFSADGVDPGSRLLAEALPAKLGARVLDLGAGWGYLSQAALSRAAVKHVTLVEADLRALDCARQNITDPRASFHWADATQFAEDGDFNSVLCNPPFHTGRAGTPALGQSFIRAAARLMKPAGQLWLVANRHLPYEAHLSAAFGVVEEIGGDRSYKLFRAARPGREFRNS